MHGVRAFSKPWRGMGHEGMLRVYLFAKLHRDENVASIFFRKERDTVDPLKAAEKNLRLVAHSKVSSEMRNSKGRRRSNVSTKLETGTTVSTKT